MRNYRIMPDIPFNNGQGRCNNGNCPNPAIYWCKAVLNADTGKQLPLNEPFTGLRPPQIHGCMKEYRPGVFLDKYDNKGRKEKEEEDNWNKRKGYTGPPPPPSVNLGVTHLWYEGEFRKLYKCPLCHFQNIHKDVINHHIRYASDKYHNSSGITI
jgi:hypothetical protein